MSFWGNFKSFFDKVGSVLEKLFGKQGIETTIVATITYVGPIVQTVATLLGGPAIGTEVGNILTEIKAGLATLSTVVQAGTVTAGSTAAQTIQTVGAAIKANLASLLQLAEVKNSAEVSKVTAYVTLVDGEIDAMLSGLTGLPAAPATPAA